MCRKKPAGPITEDGNYTKLLSAFAVNDYPGYVNDLNGCLNDQDDYHDLTVSQVPSVAIEQFRDSQFTDRAFLNSLRTGVEHFQAVENPLVAFLMDCCFSGSNTRALAVRNGLFGPKIQHVHTNRFWRIPDVNRGIYPAHKLLSQHDVNSMKWIAISACMENQTSADALINGRYNGAFTFCLIKAYTPGITYIEWVRRTNVLLKKYKFEQIATIEGPQILQERIVFTGNFWHIQVSSHGTQIPDRNGDEADGYDEAIYPCNGVPISDDVIYDTMQNLPNVA